jgi:hypothetical protein
MQTAKTVKSDSCFVALCGSVRAAKDNEMDAERFSFRFVYTPHPGCETKQFA